MKSLHERFSEETIIINLMLTEQCNFKCAHCFYSSSPQSPRGYMSDEILWKVKAQVDELKNCGFYPRINLIGGEPTLNMKEFKRVLDFVGEWNVEIEMTTNGWWLKNEKYTLQFLKIIKPYVDARYAEDGMVIRVSNDRYHDEFRPKYLQGKNALENYFSNLFESGELFYKENWYCNECGHDWEDYQDECPECQSDDIDSEYVDADFYIEPPNSDNPYIYIESNKYNDDVIPIGRGAQVGGLVFGQGSHLSCGIGDKLTYTPSGQFTDFCCRGSNMGRGTVEDDPFVLLDMALKFHKQIKPNCFTCIGDTDAWTNDNWETEIEKSIRKIQRMKEDYYERGRE